MTTEREVYLARRRIAELVGQRITITDDEGTTTWAVTGLDMHPDFATPDSPDTQNVRLILHPVASFRHLIFCHEHGKFCGADNERGQGQ